MESEKNISIIGHDSYSLLSSFIHKPVTNSIFSVVGILGVPGVLRRSGDWTFDAVGLDENLPLEVLDQLLLFLGRPSLLEFGCNVYWVWSISSTLSTDLSHRRIS